MAARVCEYLLCNFKNVMAFVYNELWQPFAARVSIIKVPPGQSGANVKVRHLYSVVHRSRSTAASFSIARLCIEIHNFSVVDGEVTRLCIEIHNFSIVEGEVISFKCA